MMIGKFFGGIIVLFVLNFINMLFWMLLSPEVESYGIGAFVMFLIAAAFMIGCSWYAIKSGSFSMTSGSLTIEKKWAAIIKKVEDGNLSREEAMGFLLIPRNVGLILWLGVIVIHNILYFFGVIFSSFETFGTCFVINCFFIAIEAIGFSILTSKQWCERRIRYFAFEAEEKNKKNTKKEEIYKREHTCPICGGEIIVKEEVVNNRTIRRVVEKKIFEQRGWNTDTRRLVSVLPQDQYGSEKTIKTIKECPHCYWYEVRESTEDKWDKVQEEEIVCL